MMNYVELQRQHEHWKESHGKFFALPTASRCGPLSWPLDARARAMGETDEDLPWFDFDMTAIAVDPDLPQKKPLNVKRILEVVCKGEGVKIEWLLGPRRQTKLVQARHIAMYLFHNITHFPLLRMEKIFRKDHTSILHGIRKMHSLYASDLRIRELIDYYEAVILAD